MKHWKFILMAIIITSCNSKSKNSAISANVQNSTAKVEVYYFHQTKGCKTCKVIGQITNSFFKNNYSDQPTEVSFKDVNISIPENQLLAKKFEVNWSGLIISVHTNEGEKVEDLTEFVFAYAIDKPDTIETVLKQKINNYLN